MKEVFDVVTADGVGVGILRGEDFVVLTYQQEQGGPEETKMAHFNF